MNRSSGCAALLALISCGGAPATARAPDTSAREAQIFAPGVISTGGYESHPALSPDGATFYFVRSSPNFKFWTILESHLEGGRWQMPEVAPFSGQYSDADPFITSDGKHLYFISKRPSPDAPGKPKTDTDIWVMDRDGAAWGTPRNLGAPVNSSGSEWYPTMAADGTLYFGSDRPGGLGATDLYRARFIEGHYAEPENLGPVIKSAEEEYEPWISPDQRMLVFMACGRPDTRGSCDLYVSHRDGDAWTPPRNLGDGINSAGTEYSPKFSPDGKYFFWSSSRQHITDAPQPARLDYAALMKKLDGPGNGLCDIYRIEASAVKW